MSYLTRQLERPLQWKFFTDHEAWSIFRLAAFGEAVGWTLLISGILIGKYVTPGNGDAVMVAGQVHGFLFFVYISAALGTAGSFGWSLRKTVIAGLMSIPPYGTLMFEKYEAHKRLHVAAKQARQISVWALITDGSKLLVIQPKDSANWGVPGAPVYGNQTIETALTNHLLAAFGIRPKLGNTVYIREAHDKEFEQLEFYIFVQNAAKFIKKLPATTEYDEISLGQPAQIANLQPAFLQNVQLKTLRDQTIQLVR